MEKNTIKKLVTLIPHDKFFFGGENTFGENNSNYFVKSNYFPQQTTVLGLIRYQLLLQCKNKNIFKNNKIKDSKLAKELIGEKSFSVDGSFEFGKIKSLSPVFICNNNSEKGNDFYFPANKEYNWQKIKDENGEDKKELTFLQIKLEPEMNDCETKKDSTDKNTPNILPQLINYDAKEGLPDLLINKDEKLLKYDEVFKPHKQTGIRKNYDGKSDDNAYYVQTFYRFAEAYCFAFVVELCKDTNFKTQKIVTFGGEQQTFKMEISDFDEDINDYIPNYKKSTNTDKIVLLSDAYINGDILSDCYFAITKTVSFRFLQTKNTTANYYSKPTKSKRFELYKKGSVFYGDPDMIAKHLDVENFIKLGYNQYKTIKK